MRNPVIQALALTALLASMTILADQAPEDTLDQQPLVSVDVSIEMKAVEQSMEEISKAFGEMAIALRQIGATGELTPEQQEHLNNIMANLDRVTEASRRSIDTLPGVVERSRTAVREATEDFIADLKFWLIIVLCAVALLLVLALACFYWFNLRPLQRTVLQATGHISNMAQAMANTSKSLEIINETHREVLRLSGFEAQPPPAGD